MYGKALYRLSNLPSPDSFLKETRKARTREEQKKARELAAATARECQWGLGTGRAAGGAWLRASAFFSSHSPDATPENCFGASQCHLSATQGLRGESKLRGEEDSG